MAYGLCVGVPISPLLTVLPGESPCRGLLRDCEIFANLRLKLYTCAGDPGDVVHDELGRHRLARPALPAAEDQSERVTRPRDRLSANHRSPLT